MLRGALCFPNVASALLRRLSVRDIVIDGPEPGSKLADRAGPLGVEDIERLWRALAYQSPPA
jgi:hypothetical protein